MINKLVSDLTATLKELSDPNRIESSNNNHPTRLIVIGVTAPNIRKVLKELKQLTQSYSTEDRFQLVHALCNSDYIECQMLGFMYIEKDHEVLNTLNDTKVDSLGTTMDNWVSVDCYSLMVVGQTWRRKLISKEKILSYLKSGDYWQRRIALVSTVALNLKSKGGTGDKEQTLEICARAVDDHQDMINKALSWALRELAKRDAEPVKEFMEKYKNRLHGRVIREVTHKLVYGTKN